MGSSPLARGTRQGAHERHRGVGLIPARAGNTWFPIRRYPAFGAHPRSRGEHGVLFSGCLGMRWLIPARAGNTCSLARAKRPAGAHPRSRGEHLIQLADKTQSPGSSPLARGTRLGLLKNEALTGLIPARAGNTFPFPAILSSAWAHPRSRGEHVHCWGVPFDDWGSSPLARGTPGFFFVGWLSFGLIPARAGNTLADMGLYPLHQQNRITLEPESASRIHDKQPLLTPASTTISTRLTPPRFRHRFTNNRTIN